MNHTTLITHLAQALLERLYDHDSQTGATFCSGCGASDGTSLATPHEPGCFLHELIQQAHTFEKDNTMTTNQTDFRITFDTQANPTEAARIPPGMSFGVKHHDQGATVILQAESLTTAIVKAATMLKDNPSPKPPKELPTKLKTPLFVVCDANGECKDIFTDHDEAHLCAKYHAAYVSEHWFTRNRFVKPVNP
jgi:hypothetical protein